MIIIFKPQRSDEPHPAIEVSGDTITINGEAFDFSDLPEGGVLPSHAIDSETIVSDVTRINGIINLTIRVVYGDHPPKELFDKEPREAKDGPFVLPPYNIEGAQS